MSSDKLKGEKAKCMNEKIGEWKLAYITLKKSIDFALFCFKGKKKWFLNFTGFIAIVFGFFTKNTLFFTD